MNRKLGEPRTPSRPGRRPSPDPFRFGWRYVDGRRVPLTPEDVLHPQEGDHIPENTLQARDRSYLYGVLELQLHEHPTALVLSDCLVDWGVKGLRNHSPDLSVFEGVGNRERVWRTFSVAAEGARCLLVVEIVSVDPFDPRLRDNDVKIKVREYFRAGVPWYAIVDQEEENGPRRLLGYRRGPRRFVPLPLDSQGRLLLEPVRLLLGLRDNRLVCFDAATGEEIGNLTDQARARQAAEAALSAEARARQAAEAALAAAQARIRELEAPARQRDPAG
jgi:hypothetical protein